MLFEGYLTMMRKKRSSISNAFRTRSSALLSSTLRALDLAPCWKALSLAIHPEPGRLDISRQEVIILLVDQIIERL